MAKVTVRMGVEVDGLSVHLVESVESGNPLFHAKETEKMLDALKVKIGAMVASNFGDVRRTE
jgi:hypothetical protein